MANKAGNVPWHSAALRLRSGGATANEIVETLRETAAAPSLAAVKKFLSRSSKEPVQALQLVARDRFGETPRVTLSDEDNRTVSEIFVALAKRQARVLTKAMMEAEEYLDTPHRSIEKTQHMKFAGAVELLRALKSTGSGQEMERATMTNADIRDIRVEVVRVDRNNASPSP